MTEPKTSFPMITAKSWWELRKKFNQSIPGVVTDGYLAASLDMKESSARANVLPYLSQLGIIDDEGKTLDRARQWRDDTQYPDVCSEMRKEVYPQELLDAVPNPSENRNAAIRWFGNQTGAGQNALKKMVKVYILLTEGDPNSNQGTTPKTAGRRPDTKTKSNPRKSTIESGKEYGNRNDLASRQSEPSVNINLQIHISSDATPDQIDQIFESMSKHIYHKD